MSETQQTDYSLEGAIAGISFDGDWTGLPDLIAYDLHELAQDLFRGADSVDDDHRRWCVAMLAARLRRTADEVEDYLRTSI